MRIDKLAMTSREALQTAMSTAADAQAGAVEPIHLLSALLGAGERNISVIIERIGADPVWLSQNVADEIAKMPKQTGATRTLHTGCHRPRAQGFGRGPADGPVQ